MKCCPFCFVSNPRTSRYDTKYEIGQQIVAGTDLSHLPGTSYVTVPVQDLNGYHQDQLPSYDAAIAQQYESNYVS